MKRTILLLTGLIPTILVFTFASPWLGLVIGLIELIILNLVWWMWTINIRTMVEFFSLEYKRDPEELFNKILGENYYKCLQRTVRKDLNKGKN